MLHREILQGALSAALAPVEFELADKSKPAWRHV